MHRGAILRLSATFSSRTGTPDRSGVGGDSLTHGVERRVF